MLHHISRRDFVGHALFTAFLAKNFVLSKGSARGQAPLSPRAIRAFMCQANSEMAASYLRVGKHMDRDSMLAQVASHKELYHPTDGADSWMSQFTPGGAPNIFPGWALTFLSRPKGQIEYDRDGTELQFATGFIYSMTDGKIILITDELSWIYVAPVPPTPMDLNKLTGAKDFPGGLIDDDDQSLYDKLETKRS